MSSDPNVNPPESSNSNLTLDGMNGMAYYNSQTITTPSYNLNGPEEYMHYYNLYKFLSTPMTVPTVNTSALTITPDPEVEVPEFQKAIFPEEAEEPLPANNGVVLVVGGSRNLGKIISEYLDEDYDVIATSRYPEAYFGDNRNPLLSDVPLDIRSQSSVDNFFNSVIKPLGRLDVLILAAGLYNVGPMQMYTADQFTNVAEVKIFGYNRCITAALPYLRSNPNSRVLAFSSVIGCEMYTQPFVGMSSVCNHAVDALVKQYNLDELLLAATSSITNKVTYITIEPVPILSTAGTFNFFQGTTGYLPSILSAPSHAVQSAVQSGLAAGAGFPTSDTGSIGAQIKYIISAPQPAFKYFIGENISFGEETVSSVVANSLQVSDVELCNQTLLSMKDLYSKTMVDSFKESLSNLYAAPI